MNITPETVEQFVGIAVALSFPVVAVISLAKNNPGVDGYKWGSNGLTWDRPNPKQDQQHPAARAE